MMKYPFRIYKYNEIETYFKNKEKLVINLL